MVFEKIRAGLAERRDPFSTRKFKGLTPLEQEKALTEIATKEAEVLEAKEAKAKSKSAERVKRASAEGIRKASSKKSLESFREKLIAKEEKKRASKKEARKVPLRKRFSGAFGSPVPSQATRQRNRAIFDRASLSVKTRAKAIEFRSKIAQAGMKPLINRETMFRPMVKPSTPIVRPLTSVSPQGNTISGATQAAQAALKEKINRANVGSGPSIIRGSPAILKAPPRGF